MNGMSIDDLSQEDRESLLAERRQEYKSFWTGPNGRGSRFTIEMFPLLYADKPSALRALIPATHDTRLRELAETFGKYFKQELGFDSIPFTAEADSPSGDTTEIDVVLFDAQRVTATFPVAAGAAGLSVVDGERWLDWIWIHPFERGKRLARLAWEDLEAVYGDQFKIQPPLSPAMEHFLDHQSIAPTRWRF